MGHSTRTTIECPICHLTREGAWCANIDDSAFFQAHLDVWFKHIFDGPVYPAPHSICTKGPSLPIDDEDERLNLPIEYDSLFAMTLGKTRRSFRPSSPRHRVGRWKGEPVPSHVFKVKLLVMAVHGRCIRPSCQAPFLPGQSVCRRGHRLGTFLAFICSECEEAFGRNSRRCPCGYHEEDVPERPPLYQARAWRGLPVPWGVVRTMQFVVRHRGRCSQCGRRMSRRFQTCSEAHSVGDPIGFSCALCGELFDPDTGLCICGYHEEDVPIEDEDD